MAQVRGILGGQWASELQMGWGRCCRGARGTQSGRMAHYCREGGCMMCRMYEMQDNVVAAWVPISGSTPVEKGRREGSRQGT